MPIPLSATEGENVVQHYANTDFTDNSGTVTADAPCETTGQFEASLVWLNREPGFVGRSYWLLIGSSRVTASITGIKHASDIGSFEKLSAKSMNQNDIGEVTLSLEKAVSFEEFKSCGALGDFVLIDRYTLETVAAGTIKFALRRAKNIHRQTLLVDRNARERLNGHAGKVLWFTGLSGAGKSTISSVLEQALHERGMRTYILDGDNVRLGLNKDLGFTDADRVENIRRISEVAKLMLDAGMVVITSFISPFRAERDMARAMFSEGEFVEIYVNVPLDVGEARDPKGLYRKARKGLLPNFTGIDSAYEAPLKPDLELLTAELSVEDCVEQILRIIGASPLALVNADLFT